MNMNEFEIEIVKAIGKHQPVILDVIDELEVSKRELTGPGLFVDFKPIEGTLDHHVQLLDFC